MVRQIIVIIEEETRERFRRWCKEKGSSMQKELRGYIEEKVGAGEGVKGEVVDPRQLKIPGSIQEQSEDDMMWRYRLPFGGEGVDSKRNLVILLKAGKIAKGDILGRAK